MRIYPSVFGLKLIDVTAYERGHWCKTRTQIFSIVTVTVTDDQAAQVAGASATNISTLFLKNHVSMITGKFGHPLS